MLHLSLNRYKVTSIFLSTSSEKLQYFPIKDNSYLRVLLDILRSTLPAERKEKICRVQKVNQMVILFYKYTHEHKVLSKYDTEIQKIEKNGLFQVPYSLEDRSKGLSEVAFIEKESVYYRPCFVHLFKGFLFRMQFAG